MNTVYLSTNLNITGESFLKARAIMGKYNLTEIFVDMIKGELQIDFYRNSTIFLKVSKNDYKDLKLFMNDFMVKHSLVGVDFWNDEGDIDVNLHYVVCKPPLCCFSTNAFNEYIRAI